jgi:uncharacterized membrane protein YeaQ/YmgE (transglycosylase-associated protein family)
VGFSIGLIARALLLGAQPRGFFAPSVLGIVGSLVGGFIGSLIPQPREASIFHPAGFFGSILGALIVLYLWIRFL